MPPVYEYDKVPPPRSVGDVPRFLKELLGGFFKRFFYIVGIVWQTGHWILFLMTFLALFNGLTPVIGALLSKEIINELQAANTGVGVFSLAHFHAAHLSFYLPCFKKARADCRDRCGQSFG